MKEIFEKIYLSEDLEVAEMNLLTEAMFSGQLSDAQIAAILIGLKIKGITPTEMATMAQVLKSKSLFSEEVPTDVMDNCGTGGDHLNSFNVSTTTSFVLAAGGIKIAKHGNRSISSRSGSADVLEALGISITLSNEKIAKLLNEVGITFLFAPSLHPAMRFVSSVRQELATPTILNVIGPLTNPIPLKTQLLGTYEGSLITKTAETLAKMDRQRAIVLQGAHGMDEANLSGTTHYTLLADGKVTEGEISPQEIDLPTYPLSAIRGGNAHENAIILQSVLKNEPSPFLDTVALNAGFGFFANGQVISVEAGVKRAKQILQSGVAYDKFRQLLQTQKEWG